MEQVHQESTLPTDPYETLGVSKDASQEAIQKVYRRLAKKFHPDLNPGNKQAEEKFKDISAAYDLLGDPQRRARFDRGEIDASGAERARHRYYRDFADAGASNRYASDAGFADFGNADDVFSEIFGRHGRANLRMRGQDVHYRLELDFLDAINGGKQQLTLPDGSVLDVAIPPGTRDGQILRLRGKGRPGIGGGPSGDALIEIHVRPHRIFARKGDDIHVEQTSLVPALGASGAIAGVLGCYMRFFPLARVIVLVPILFIPLFFEVYASVFVGLWFLLQVLQGMTELLMPSSSGGVAWWAHVGGFIAGYLLGPALCQSERRYRVYYPDEGELGFSPAGRP